MLGLSEKSINTTWLANIVLVQKNNGKWPMCTDYTHLSRACPKDAYPLPSIDRLVDGATGHKVLSFLDAYSGYNQIRMNLADREKTVFITDKANFCSEVMPFGLKNAGATYHRLMDQMFRDQIGRTMEVYVDDIIVKSDSVEQHANDLAEVFQQIRKYDMRLNSEKCMFGVEGGKFLGFMLTSRGIEANPDKCRALETMRSPGNLKEVQRLVGRLTSLSRFMPRLADKIRPILRLMKKPEKFTWNESCEAAFQTVKKALAEPPILSKPVHGIPLLVYLAVSPEAVSVAVVQGETEQKLVYFVSRVLQDAETRYQMIEKVALALVHASRRLRQYFQSHEVIVRTDFPINKILQKLELAGRMIGWSVELSEFSIKYEPQGPIKSQCLADFTSELQQCQEPETIWILHVDGSSSKKGGGAKIVLEGPENIQIEQSLRFGFSTSNNQAEYEALIVGLLLAKDVGAQKVECHTDSQLMVEHVNGNYQIKDPLLLKYYHRVVDIISQFQNVKISHVKQQENMRADTLSKLATAKTKGRHASVIQQILSAPSVPTGECMVTEKGEDDWVADMKKAVKDREEGKDGH